mgnify:CR=1 FL=1
MSIHVEYISDRRTRRKMIMMPQRQWEKFYSEHQKLQRKLEILSGIQKAMKEVKRVGEGKKKLKTLREVLNEL